MRERPVIFNANMVRAVLDGRKTQTRRIMKVQPSEGFNPLNMSLETDFKAHWYTPGIVDKDGYLQPAKKQVLGVASEDEGYTCPFGAVGVRLWVREAWQAIHDSPDEHGNVDERTWMPSILKKPDSYWHPVYGASWGSEDRETRGFPWRPSIHMPRWASRITLEITGVRVERLNSINEHDAISEGLAEISKDGRTYKYGIPDRDGYPGTDDFGWPWHEWDRYPISAYSKLWQSIYGADIWQANPWVWVIEFKRVEVE